MSSDDAAARVARQIAEDLYKQVSLVEVGGGHRDRQLARFERTVAKALDTFSKPYREALALVLPMAKGYAAQHDVGSNQEYIRIAETALAPHHPEDATPQPEGQGGEG